VIGRTAVSARQFTDQWMGGQQLGEFSGVPADDSILSTANPVLGEPGDYFE
jgi:hypothetical protein